MEEPTIERIALENPNNIREQCFQMLKTFERQQGAECTCRRLGEALLQSEKNRHLFGKFVPNYLASDLYMCTHAFCFVSVGINW